MKKILFVTTNYDGSDCHDESNCLYKTGVNLEEFAIPYFVFKSSGFEVIVASILGGVSPVDEKSLSCSNPVEWDDCIKILRKTEKISNLDLCGFDCLYFPGGHGVMFDIAYSKEVAKLVEYFYYSNKLICAICHGVAGLIGAKDKNNISILKNVNITAFTNKEEEILLLNKQVPFSLENEIKKLGANFICAKPWEENVIVDNRFITGQNKQSTLLLAEKVFEKLSS